MNSNKGYTDIEKESLAGHVLVIGRQFGSGGRTLGREMASLLGVKFYDNELLTEAALRFGFDANLLREADERRPSMLRGIIDGGMGWLASTIESAPAGADAIYSVQSRTIELIAREGGAVFVGRTADYILRHHPRMTSVFLHAPLDIRARRIVERGECADIEAATEKAKKIDKLREGYYNYYTGRQWGKADNYHLSLSTAELDPAEYAPILLQHIMLRSGCSLANKTKGGML